MTCRCRFSKPPAYHQTTMALLRNAAADTHPPGPDTHLVWS